jgi:hypothetical protein
MAAAVNRQPVAAWVSCMSVVKLVAPQGPACSRGCMATMGEPDPAHPSQLPGRCRPLQRLTHAYVQLQLA